MKKAIAELSAALIAIVGCVWSWLAAATPAQIEPVIAGEPAKASVNYDPVLLSLALVLAAVAGVLLVFGVGALRRTR
ncbi:hypothetical protein ABIA30_001897 [Mycobacterium sp. MAA66]|uniref:hypothetical protein n=1 Tax=Mycobacterium sp. MAA66 TaxID=3156297 RepID=UPI003510F59B